MTHILVRPKVQQLTLISSCIASVRVEVERPKHFSYKLRRSQSRRDSKMASSLRLRGLNLVNTRRTAFTSLTRWFSSADALVEIKPGEIGMVSGIPEQHLRRRVIIYSPARTATQQGSGKVGRWQINFVSTQKWGNPLMGWTSTGDPYANVGEAALKFDSQEAAIEFAEKYGWEYSVKKRHTPLLKVKAYADNFKWKGPASSQG